jgi:uncharacterized protein YjbI with pentapeptide repeats
MKVSCAPISPKVDAEKAKLDAEKRKLGSDKAAEWAKIIGTFMLAAAAIGTWWATSSKNEQERDARYRADAARLIESLGAQQAQLRAAAAIGLRSFANDERTHSLVIGSLAYSLGLETHPSVQEAMADSLVAAGGQDSVALLQRMVSRTSVEVQIGLRRTGCREKELESINAQQNAIAAAVLALSRLSQLSPAPPPNFSELNFRCFSMGTSFLRDGLRGAIFRRANVESANFDGMDLQGTDFSDADAKVANFTGANLKGANFSGANLNFTFFDGATLDSAQFTGADLSEATFTKATGVSEQQLKAAANLSCAKLPDALVNVLTQELQPPPGKMCY